MQVTAGPTEVRHVDSARTVTLQIRPAPLLALGEALDILQHDVIEKLFEEGLPPGVRIRLSGTADKLLATAAEMKRDLVIALAIVYLVMAVLFESFIYPLIIVLSVPLATAGGVIGLNILNLFHFQALDMLTLLGFVILIGIVVNNAILLRAPDALSHPRGRLRPRGRDRRGDAESYPADLHVNPDQRRRDDAIGDLSRGRFRDLPGARFRRRWWAVAFRVAYPRHCAAALERIHRVSRATTR